MFDPIPIPLEQDGIRLEPMTADHGEDIIAAAADGELWDLWYTAVPDPEDIEAYIETALQGLAAGHMAPWVIRDVVADAIIGSTRFHDIIAPARRVEIGYTFYAKRYQRSHVNTQCKLMLMTYAFETCDANVVGFRTDGFNFASQKAIEALGAKKDGVLRKHMRRKNGSVRDSVFYSIIAEEWTDVKRHLERRMARLRAMKQ